MAEHVLAVLVDFENMARPGAKSRGDFDINLVLSRLAEKGRVVVKRAYADWSRYREAKMDLQNAGLELIEMPSAREGAKNRADIKLAVDAMELAFSREHLDNFVIVSGDSDFTPLVGKLRELNKRVIGVGNRESSSELLIANCDEFIYYDSIASSSRRSSRGGSRKDPIALLQESLMALLREGVELPLASVVKDAMRRKDPAFDENALGFSTFSKFLEASATKAGITLQTDPRSGTYRVSTSESTATITVASGDDGDGDDGRRRRRRGGRGRGGASGDAPGATAEAAAERRSRGGAAVEAAGKGADIFEVFVTPTPDPDLGQLPSLDEPITYEDMVLLTPEVDAEVKAAGIEEDDPDAPPARSTRRRRRRASTDADTESEPTPDDLETIADEDVAAEEASEAGLAEIGETPTPEEQVEAEAPPLEEAEGKPKRRRTTRKKADEEAPAEDAAEAKADEPAEEEKPKRRRTTRKKADEEAPAEDAAEAKAPSAATKSKASTKSAAKADEAGDDEKPASRRRVRRSSAASTEEEPAAE
ncbi:MAG: NYN domain-containing protein [Miltoncostaeaceae bacterium]